MTAPVRPAVLLVDDHRAFSDALRIALVGSGSVSDCRTAASAREAVEVFSNPSPPDVLVCDLEIPGDCPFALVETLRRRGPRLKVLILSAHGKLGMVRRAELAGIDGYVLKTEPVETVLESIRTVAAGGRAFSPAIAKLLEQLGSPGEGGSSVGALASLTKRQLDVLRLVAQGLSVKETAKRLFLAPKSVEGHKTRLMAVLGLHDRVALARFAWAHGLATPPAADAMDAAGFAEDPGSSEPSGSKPTNDPGPPA